VIRHLPALALTFAVWSIPVSIGSLVVAVVSTRLRKTAASLISLTGQLWLFAAFVMSCSSLYFYFGPKELTFGLLFLVIGVVPYALIVLSINHLWALFWIIAGLSVFGLAALRISYRFARPYLPR
jgi:hypothetical protein